VFYRLKVAQGVTALVEVRPVKEPNGKESIELAGTGPTGKDVGVRCGTQRECEEVLREGIRNDLFNDVGHLAGLCWRVSKWGAKATHRNTSHLTVEDFSLRVHPGFGVPQRREVATASIGRMVDAGLAKWHSLQCPDRNGDAHFIRLTGQGQELANTVQKIMQSLAE
jgi:hypothetical protein